MKAPLKKDVRQHIRAARQALSAAQGALVGHLRADEAYAVDALRSAEREVAKALDLAIQRRRVDASTNQVDADG